MERPPGEGPPRTEPIEPEPPPPPAPRPLGLPWRAIIVRGLLAFLIMILLGEVLAVLGAVEETSGLSSLDVGKIGAMLFYGFHHVGISVEVPTIPFPGAGGQVPFGLDFSFTVAVAMLLATFLAGWLLYRGGRAAAAAAQGSWRRRVLGGALVGVPYAALSFGLSFLITFGSEDIQIPGVPGGQSFEVGPSAVAALLWPLGIGAALGALGALALLRDDVFRGRWGERLRAILGGGTRMAWYGLVFSFLGLLVLAAVKPGDTAAYFEGVQEAGAAGGALLILVTLLFVPNMAMWVLGPAMGASVGLFGAGLSCELISYTQFPLGSSPQGPGGAQFGDFCALLSIDQGTAPAGYFLFLLVPLLASILGGRRAVRRFPVASRGEAAAVGAGGGILFALIFLVLAILAGVSAESTGGGIPFFFAGGRIQVGPDLVLGTILAAAWGAAGGAIGGAWAARRARPEPTGSAGFEPAPPPAGPTEPV